MKKLYLVLFLITITVLQGCSVQLTSELKEKIDRINEEISHLKSKKAELETVEEDIARLKTEVATAKAKWEKYLVQYADEIEIMQKKGN